MSINEIVMLLCQTLLQNNDKFLLRYSYILFHIYLLLLKKLLAALLKQLKVLTKLQEIHLLILFISCFIVSVTPSINTAESSNDFIILMTSFISSIEKNVNPFHALAVLFPLIFQSNLFIALEAKLLTNPGKGITIIVRAFLPKLANQVPKDPPD